MDLKVTPFRKYFFNCFVCDNFLTKEAFRLLSSISFDELKPYSMQVLFSATILPDNSKT